MSTLLITGGAGFVGHAVVEHFLHTTDWDIVSLDRLDFSGNLNRLAEVTGDNRDFQQRLRIVWHDLKAEINPQVAAQIGEVDYIFHLAAASHVDRSIEFPMEFAMDNVVGTVNLLNFAREYQTDTLKLLIYFSTDEVFGPAPPGVHYGEDDRYDCGNPYSASKAGAEQFALAYENTYKMPIVVTHTMNVFGIRQHPEKYIPKIIRYVLDGKTLSIHADSTRTIPGSRHYIDNGDVASALRFLVDHAVIREKYNIVGKEECDNLQLAQTIAGILGKPLNYELVDFHSARPGHDLRYALSGRKMERLGWVPGDIRQRLQKTVEWYLAHQERWLPR